MNTLSIQDQKKYNQLAELALRIPIAFEDRISSSSFMSIRMSVMSGSIAQTFLGGSGVLASEMVYRTQLEKYKRESPYAHEVLAAEALLAVVLEKENASALVRNLEELCSRK